jgi:hypothetical protein
MGDWRLVVRFPAEGRNFPLLQNVQTGCRATRPRIEWVPAVTAGSWRVGCVAEHLVPRLKISGAIPPRPHKLSWRAQTFMFETTERKWSCDYSTSFIPNSLETSNILYLLRALQNSGEFLIKVEHTYLIVRAQNFSSSPLHLISALFFYMRCKSEGIFAYCNARIE